MFDEGFAVAHEGGLVVDQPNIDALVDESPETFGEAQRVFDHEMAQIEGRPSP